jgi:hypothetical protein
VPDWPEPGRAVPAAEHEEWLPGAIPAWAPLVASPREWPAGLHEIHCRDDRCSLGCDCPCHRGLPVPPLVSGVTGDEAVAKLVILGYTSEQANFAVAQAMNPAYGVWPLRDHAVYAGKGTDTFAIYTIIVSGTAPWAADVTLTSPRVNEVPAPGRQAFDEVLGGGPEAVNIPMRAQAALNTLIAMGYEPSAVNDALAQTGMTGDGMAILERHAVTRLQDGTYVISLVDPLHGMTGHQLSDEQIRRHGKDRYPTAASNYAKVLDEAGELGEALMELYAQAHIHDDDGTVEGCPGCFAAPQEERVKREYADTGLALFALGRKLGLDLIQCMHDLVAGDTRDFREPGQEG